MLLLPFRLGLTLASFLCRASATGYCALRATVCFCRKKARRLCKKPAFLVVLRLPFSCDDGVFTSSWEGAHSRRTEVPCALQSYWQLALPLVLSREWDACEVHEVHSCDVRAKLPLHRRRGDSETLTEGTGSSQRWINWRSQWIIGIEGRQC